MDTKKRALLEETYERIINVGLCIVPYEDLSDLVAPEPMLFGTTKDEKVFSFSELDAMFKSQYEQMVGFVPSLDRKRLLTRFSNDGNNAFITEEATLTISSPKDVNTIFIRCSCVMEYIDKRWKLTHWHASTPVETENDHWHREEWKREKEKLQNLVDQQTAALKRNNRELQIEAALERVRAMAMAMQKSGDLRTVVVTLYEQLKNLGFQWGVASIVIMDPDSGDMDWWMEGLGDGFVLPERYHVPYFEHSGHLQQLENWKSGRPYAEIEISGQEKKTFDAYYFFQTDFSHAPEQSKQLMMQGESVRFSMAFMKYGALSWAPTPLLKEQATILEHFAKVFEQCYTRFLDLQKAESQAREAQIEAALERVRSRTLAMQKSDELQEVVRVVAEELKNTGVILDTWGAVICTYFQDSKDVLHWTASEDPANPSVAFLLPYFEDELYDEAWASKNRGDSYFAKVFSFEVKNGFFKHAFENSDYRQLPDDYKKLILESESHGIAWAWSKNSAIMIPSIQGDLPSEAEKEILIRFARVFEQSFIRFLDLQKAEAQAREAQIETALEIVRSRSLAMHKSDELNEVVSVLFEKLKELQIPFTAVGIGIYIEGSKDLDSYVCGENEAGLVITNYRLPYFNNQIPIDLINAFEKQLDFFVGHYSKEVKDSFYNYVLEHTPEFRHLPEDIKHMIFDSPTYTISMVAVKNAVFNINDFEGKVLAENEIDIIKRFARVFDQAYTRFLDLQKAEEQAQEAQIEAALERLRSRSMAMHRSEELSEVASVLYQELVKLGITDFVNCGFVEIDEKNNSQKGWNTNPDGSPLEGYFLPLSGEDVLDERYKAWKEQVPLFLQRVGEERLRKHMEFAIPTLGSKQVEEMTKANFPDPTYFYCCNFKNGYLSIIAGKTYSPEEEALMIRFTNAFAQTYTRFLDLQKAEAQAREATKQASLDRVRGEISSMRSANDLNRITPLVFNELTTLGIPFIRCGVFIVNEKRNNVEIYLSTPEGKSLAVMTLPFDANEMTTQSVKAWKKEEVYVQHWNQTDFINWSKSMAEQGYVKDLKTYQGTAVAPDNLHLHFVPFDQGLLYVGSTENLSEEQIDLVKALASAFSIAYARYEDFVKLEQAKTEVESAMSELKATQSQLVQQEKLASLGQLTAGIAHEIKNPLNFVNNFSEVSIELIEEAQDEITNVETQYPASLLQNISELLDDVQSNLTKIHEHGSRANNIVSSMLQHSRGGSGKKEPTDLNALIREYVNLSFHGMRAGKNPIDVDIQLKLDDSIGDVPLIAEDFSRIILNLCNNAFDAMRSVETASLRVRTKKSDDAITIEIEDNGPGIPDEIKDKILQPFFTTKKGTEGTGLGLSITHDIVKAHGGELKVESEVGKGTEFCILIPIS